MRAALWVVVVMVLSGLFHLLLGNRSQSISGESVYISEGCIHCHSQYSRPNTLDTIWYGPASVAERKDDTPVLIGNRRQGPDLSAIGLRRSREWNKAHLIDPQSVTPGSRMPRYAHLFEGEGMEGEALLDYLGGLGTESVSTWLETRQGWASSTSDGNREAGEQLFQQICANCHGEDASGNGLAADKFMPRPTNLKEGKTRFLPKVAPDGVIEQELAKIIKFGVMGTSMPGHEYLTEQQVWDLVIYVRSFSLREEGAP